MFRRLPPVFWIVLLWWTAYALIFATQVVWMEEQQGNPVSWQEAIKYSFGGWMTWVPLSLALYWLVSRYPVERGRVLVSLSVLLAAALTVVLLRAAYVSFSNPLFGWYGASPLPPFHSVLATAFTNNFMMAWLVIGIAHAMVFYQRSQERGHKVAELEHSLNRSQLEALRAQLNPHFLFNALNSVAEMVHQDAELADRMLMSLAAMLRESLSSEHDQLRTLGEELALVDHYLTIEKIRLGDRLHVVHEVDPECRELQVPALILQPLVENAIVHGIARRRHRGTLRIGARKVGDALWLEIANSVASEEAGVRLASGNGIGLQSASSRLQLLYGTRGDLVLETTTSGEYRVRVSVPLASAPRRQAGQAAQ